MARLSVRDRNLLVLTFTPVDENGAAVTPTSATWSLYGPKMQVINSRHDVVATPATSMDIVLSGADTARLTSEEIGGRVCVMRYKYTSTLGADMENNLQQEFDVLPLADAP